MKFHEFIRLAKHVQDTGLEVDEDVPDSKIIMRRSSIRPNNREFTELLKRFRALSPAQREVIADLDSVGQRQVAFVGICKAHPFIRDFMIEVVREKFFGFDFQLSDADFQSFMNIKRELHPELERYSESTGKKARQVLWRILEQAGLIDKTGDKIILPQFLGQRVINVVRDDNPALLQIFLMTDRDIRDLTL